MAVIINLATGESIKVKQQPVWADGAWFCGDIQYSDPDKKDFAAGPPIVGPIRFKLLFKITELVAINELIKTDLVIQVFMGIVDDPRTDVIDMSLDPVQGGIKYALSKVYSAPEDQIILGQRVSEILSGELL